LVKCHQLLSAATNCWKTGPLPEFPICKVLGLLGPEPMDAELVCAPGAAGFSVDAPRHEKAMAYGTRSKASKIAQTERRPIHNDDLAPAQISTLFSTALVNAATWAMPGAAIYASVPAGPLLPAFIAAMEQGGFAYRHCLVWVKQNFVLGRSDYHYRHEPILYGWREDGPHYFIEDRTQDSVFEVDRPMVSELHPTQKPIELIARMVANSSRPGELVYDPFCGSGSTLLAAHQLGRIGYGVEIDPGYVAVTLERFSMLGLKPELARDNA
jgi:hypothetical protein